MATYMRPLLNNLFLQNHLMTSPHSMISAWPGTVTNICTEYEKRKLHVSQQWPEEILVQLGAPVCILDFSLLETNATSVLMTKKQVKQPTIGWPSVEDCEIPVCRCHPVLRPHTHTHTHKPHSNCWAMWYRMWHWEPGHYPGSQSPDCHPQSFLHIATSPWCSTRISPWTCYYSVIYTASLSTEVKKHSVLHNSYTDNSQLQKCPSQLLHW